MSDRHEAPHTRDSHHRDRRDPPETDGTGDYREENLPDGEEVFQAWKEGPDRVIEKRSGPGEDVIVEVQKNVYDSKRSPARLISPEAHRMEDLIERAEQKVKAKYTGKRATEHGRDAKN
ncbi:hypothetical protein OBBRIDRAFT_886841 [Obba rivulosa]|uniref:Uncharacterized protein n=1 Tax=Obba rivulosa TaxID=1052685 RepID=A0A8E2B0S8_9APHY|nr:hypothetical protein OBBRIDRAFT_886841 [Obba rivulosa]